MTGHRHSPEHPMARSFDARAVGRNPSRSNARRVAFKGLTQATVRIELDAEDLLEETQDIEIRCWCDNKMKEQCPSKLAGRVFDGNQLHVWDTERLWRLSKELDVFEVPIDDLPEFDSDEHWYGYGSDTPTCRSVASHAKQIQNCDLTYPIILSFDNHVLDGMHRVAKAWILGLATLPAVRFEKPVDPDLVLEVEGRIDPEEVLKRFSSNRPDALAR